MTDPDKQISPHQAAAGDESPEREPWSQRDAKAMHALDLVWRLIIGAIAGLGGGVLLVILILGAHEFATKGAFTTGDLEAIGLSAVLGGMMTAFGIGQVMQLVWVGGDQGFDARLWGNLTSRERGLWRLREGSGGRWTFRLFIAITLAALLYADAVLAPLLWQQATAGRWLPLAAAALSTAAMVALAIFIFSRNARRSSAASNAVWVSQGRWVVKGHWPTRGNSLLLLAMSVAFFAAGLHREDLLIAGGCIVIAVLSLVGGLAMLREVLRNRRHDPPELEVVREVDRPLVLACKATLPLSAEEATRGAWLAKFQAYGSKIGSRIYMTPYYVWLEAKAPVIFEVGSGKASFTLRIDMPKHIPVPYSIWTIRLENADRRKPIEFLLPNEIAFTEEYPAS